MCSYSKYLLYYSQKDFNSLNRIIENKPDIDISKLYKFFIDQVYYGKRIKTDYLTNIDYFLLSNELEIYFLLYLLSSIHNDKNTINITMEKLKKDKYLYSIVNIYQDIRNHKDKQALKKIDNILKYENEILNNLVIDILLKMHHQKIISNKIYIKFLNKYKYYYSLYRLAMYYDKIQDKKNTLKYLEQISIESNSEFLAIELSFIYLRYAEFDKSFALFTKNINQNICDDKYLIDYIRIIIFKELPLNQLVSIIQILKNKISTNILNNAFLDIYILIICWVGGNSFNKLAFDIFSRLEKYNIPYNKDTKTYLNFKNFILKLYQYQQFNKELYLPINHLQKELYIIGDSHSLTYANIIDEQSHMKYNTKFIMGIKMFHLGLIYSKYKTFFEYVYFNLPSNSIILLTIGEIDCRPNEGIFYHAKKYNKDLEKITKATISNYLEYLSRIKQQHDIIIRGIPEVGNISYSFSNLSQKEVEEFKNFIEYFNKILKNKVAEYGFNFIDIYKNTKDYHLHIDGYHLKPHLIQYNKKKGVRH